jgi:hypothetical protein
MSAEFVRNGLWTGHIETRVSQNHVGNIWAFYLLQVSVKRLRVGLRLYSKREPAHQQTRPFGWQGLAVCG